MRFEFATAQRVLFGAGVIQDLAGAAKSMGRRALMVTGSSPDRVRRYAGGLDAAWFSIAGEPTVDQIRAGVQHARSEGCDVVIGFGGGSAMDGGKAIAVLLANSGEPLDYLEVVGRGNVLEQPSVPFIAIPTTAGTGAEATRNAVLASPEHGVKASLRSASMLPRLAIVDPELTRDLPRPVTASTGLDALTQLIEPYVCLRANPFTDMICVDGMRHAKGGVRLAYEQGSEEARAAMSLASLYSGMALANAGLGAVHGFAAPIGGMYAAPHGAVCAALLPHVMDVNMRALRLRMPDSPAVARYNRILEIVEVGWIKETCRQLEIPPLRTYGIEREQLGEIAEKASQASSMKANPVVLTRQELMEILERAL